MKIIKDYAPDCIAACPDVCTPLSHAITLYMSASDPVPEICKAKVEYMCVISTEHLPMCKDLLDEAQDLLNIAVPRNEAMVDATCAGCPDHCGVDVLSTSSTKGVHIPAFDE